MAEPIEILERVKRSLPKEAISRAELEGSEIIVYTKSREFFQDHETAVREVVSSMKKRIEVRPDDSLTMEQEATKKRIMEIVPEDAKIRDIYFEPERSLVVIAAEKPGLVIGRGGDTFRQIRTETFWVPRIERVPSIKSEIIEGIRKVLHREVKFRKRFLNNIGRSIFSERTTNRDWIRMIALGGYREVGRSCTLLETPKSKVLVDCGLNLGATNSAAYPILNTKEFDPSEIDAVIVSHAHLDHCLHPDSYIQLPNGVVTRIENYYSSKYNGITSFDIDNSLRVEPVGCTEKVKIKSPSELFEIRTKTKRIKVTNNHPFFVLEDSKIVPRNAEDLKRGDYIATIKDMPFEGEVQKLPELVRTVKVSKKGRKILKECRLKLGLRQEDTAVKVGCSQVTISSIENENIRFCLNLVEKISAFYGLENFIQRFTRAEFNKSTKVKLPNRTTRAFCQFLGYLLGDGDKMDAIRRGKRYTRINLTDKDVENLNLYQSLLNKVFKIKGVIKQKERNRLQVFSPLILDFINSIDPGIITRSPFRKIPEVIHKTSKPELSAFFTGLFDAEGSVGDHSVVLTSTSYDIIQVSQILLLRFGILSHLYDFKNTKSKRRVYQLMIYNPDSIKRFKKEIGFGSKTKQEKLNSLVEKVGGAFAERMDLIPLSGEKILEFAKLLNLSKSDLRKLKINYIHYLRGHKLTRKKASEIISKFKRLAKEKNLSIPELNSIETILNSKLFWEPVEKIEKAPSDTEYVYDLKVPGHHNYIANGIVVHNCGVVPYLYEHGYEGPLYCTTPTVDLFALLCLDYIDVMQRNGVNPIYTAKSVKEAVKHSIPLEYGEVSDVAPDVRLTFQNAGHILGSALVHLHIGEGLHNIVWACDMKYARTTLFEPAFTDFQRVETLILESTYGGVDNIMPHRQEAEVQLLSVINKTMERGGSVVIPTFSVERAQDVMAILVQNDFQYPVFIDGMIWDATGIFTAYPEYMSHIIQRKIFNNQDPFISSIFRRISSKAEREKAWEEKPNVILSTSGMLVGGPVMEHLKALAEDEKSTLVFVGYQAEGTMGRRIQKGWKEIPMRTDNGKTATIALKMEVQSVEGLSGHSDRNQLLSYVNNLPTKPNRIIVTHGEASRSVDLAKSIYKIFRIETAAPRNLEAIRLK